MAFLLAAKPAFLPLVSPLPLFCPALALALTPQWHTTALCVRQEAQLSSAQRSSLWYGDSPEDTEGSESEGRHHIGLNS